MIPIRPLRAIVLAALIALAAPFAAAPLASAQEAEYGETVFPTSGAPEAQEAFLRGLLMLHSFEYEDARAAFQEAQRLDPDFAMAYWGEAMSHNAPIWFRQDQEAARAALDRLAPTLEARLAKAPTSRERNYLRTVERLFGEGSKKSRDMAYASAMGELARAHPDDLDAKAFYALAILGTVHEGRDFATYMKAAAVAEEVFAKNPRHPGAVHYLIHAYDDPVHAPLGLRAARVYGDVAPSAGHALHMPSHIYVALGMWDEVGAANEASLVAARARAERMQKPLGGGGYHAIWWLCYSYLQQGRYADARALVDEVRVLAEAGLWQARVHLVRMRGAYVIETREWSGEHARLAVDTARMHAGLVAADRFVSGLAALRSAHRAEAEQALADITVQREAAKGERWKNLVRTMELQLKGSLDLDAGRTDEALASLREAAEIEDAMPLRYGPPSPVKPSHELLGEALLGLERHAEARREFANALERGPRRALSLLGTGRAAMAEGNASRAEHAFATVRRIWHRADAALQALDEIQAPQSEAEPG